MTNNKIGAYGMYYLILVSHRPSEAGIIITH